ncbi:hypothetical protein [Streptomyces sp. NPDC055099]
MVEAFADPVARQYVVHGAGGERAALPQHGPGFRPLAQALTPEGGTVVAYGWLDPRPAELLWLPALKIHFYADAHRLMESNTHIGKLVVKL